MYSHSLETRTAYPRVPERLDLRSHLQTRTVGRSSSSMSSDLSFESVKTRRSWSSLGEKLWKKDDGKIEGSVSERNETRFEERRASNFHRVYEDELTTSLASQAMRCKSARD